MKSMHREGPTAGTEWRCAGRRERAGARRVIIVMLAICAAAASPRYAGAQSPFQPLDLATPNQFRTGAGRPAAAYWQQRADYRIDATLDVAHNTLHGRETITYTNNSPATLTYVWMYVEQNICAPNSVTNTLNQPPLKFQSTVFDFSCGSFVGGLRLDSLSSNGRVLHSETYGTTMKVMLPQPLAPHMSVDLHAAWSFDVPTYGAGRMGHDGMLYEIAQWYPRMAVYDDIKGWNTEPYIGGGEFYLEYGSFDVNITLPSNFTVAATGAVQNPEIVLTSLERVRLARAHATNDPVQIITEAEAKGAANTVAKTTKTWRFHADKVRDFAFAASPGIRWDAVSYDGILVQTYYRPGADKWAAEGIRVARHAIQFFSEHWLRYPYPQASTMEGPIEGMEYPMLTFVPNNKVREDFQWTLMHEFGHQWFPMVVGSNERLYPWMDEGFNTYIDLAGAADYFKGTAYGDTIQDLPLHEYSQHAIEGEQPLMTVPVQSHDLMWTAYHKPALMMRLLREEVLGPTRFDAAFREYAKTWAFKHPAPADFMRIMADASGTDLDWFWRGWLFSTARLDQSVDAITTDSAGTVVRIVNRGTMVMPAELELTFDGGATTRVKLPIEMWNLGSTFDYRVKDSRHVVSAVLDPRAALPDIDRSNNKWPRR